MTESAWQYDVDEQALYTLPTHDPLGVLTSTLQVVEQGEHVWINADQLEPFCEQWLADKQRFQLTTPQWDTRYHFHDGSQRTVNWLLVLDALNFCFWSDKDQPRWSIEYRGERLNGYWAEAAALKRAVEEGIPLWDAEYLSTISPDVMASIFRGQQTIPLFEERVRNAREVGRVLLERYDGQFTHVIEQAGGSAVRLALLLANEFSSFHDVATYRRRPVCFFKRAQICVADLHSAFAGKQWGTFTDLDKLTAFADYKLPQILRHYKILEYTPALAGRIDNQEPIAAGSEEEIEIRAATIWACELLRQAMQRRGQQMTTAELDQRLWLASQHTTEMRPYHRTRTIFY
ncbi:MAG: hypothetical protein IMW89_00415 [Ktedonobacteraceae bacterium]|nr:hypothetical protein [Ktedonobacteraceae bacterium]